MLSFFVLLCSSFFFFPSLFLFVILFSFCFFLVGLPMSSALYPRHTSDRVEPLYTIRVTTFSCLPLAFIFKSFPRRCLSMKEQPKKKVSVIRFHGCDCE